MNSLYDDFEITTTPLLYLGDKNFEKIQQIVTSTKVANIAKQVVEVIVDLTMIDKRRSDSRSNEECFNCGKKGHYTKDCCSSTSNKKKPVVEESRKEDKYIL